MEKLEAEIAKLKDDVSTLKLRVWALLGMVASVWLMEVLRGPP